MSETRREKLRFRAWRRGFREADLILGAFADRHVSAMDEADLDRFERLLDQSDHDLYGWIVGATAVPTEFDDELMAALRVSLGELPARADQGG